MFLGDTAKQKETKLKKNVCENIFANSQFLYFFILCLLHDLILLISYYAVIRYVKPSLYILYIEKN